MKFNEINVLSYWYFYIIINGFIFVENKVDLCRLIEVYIFISLKN